MSDPVTRTPEDPSQLPSTPLLGFAAGETVPGLSSWVLERKLGGGGFGQVWLARHAWNNKEKPRAVKFCTGPAARRWLVTHEQNVVRRVMKYAGDHPNIVPLLDCNLDGDIPWLMYEFVEGGTLAGALEQWRELPLPRRLGRAVVTLHAIAGALGTFHRFDPPLVHRDMKPHNVLMAGGAPRITDFGIGGVIAQPADGSTRALTAHAAQLPPALHAAGTRIYAPPEQLSGSPPNPRDDVYALGIIAYQMVKADLRATPGADAVQELRDLKVPEEWAALIVKSIAMSADRRPKDATEWETVLAAMLQKKLQKQSKSANTSAAGSEAVLLPESDSTDPASRAKPSPAPPPSPPPEPVTQPTAKTRRAKPFRPRWLAATVVGSALALGLALAIVQYLVPQGKRSEPTAPDGRVEKPRGGPKDTPPVPKVEPPQVVPEPKTSSIPKHGETREVEIADGVKMTFCWIPPSPGKVKLGSPEPGRDEMEAEREYISPGFWLGKYEVTQGEWEKVMGDNPSCFSKDGKGRDKVRGMETSRFPVESVSWDRICGTGKYAGEGFLDKVNAHSGIPVAFGKPGKIALPHENEWEYACRGRLDNSRPFYFGKSLNGTEANCNGNYPHGTSTKGRYLERTCAVDDTNGGTYPSHPWGLMHIHGNVWEWCSNSYKQPDHLIMRGGSWNNFAHGCRAARRDYLTPNFADSHGGFRLCIRLDD